MFLLVLKRWARVEAIGRSFVGPVIEIDSADVVEHLFTQALFYGLARTVITDQHVYGRQFCFVFIGARQPGKIIRPEFSDGTDQGQGEAVGLFALLHRLPRQCNACLVAAHHHHDQATFALVAGWQREHANDADGRRVRSPHTNSGV